MNASVRRVCTLAYPVVGFLVILWIGGLMRPIRGTLLERWVFTALVILYGWPIMRFTWWAVLIGLAMFPLVSWTIWFLIEGRSATSPYVGAGLALAGSLAVSYYAIVKRNGSAVQPRANPHGRRGAR